MLKECVASTNDVVSVMAEESTDAQVAAHLGTEGIQGRRARGGARLLQSALKSRTATRRRSASHLCVCSAGRADLAGTPSRRASDRADNPQAWKGLAQLLEGYGLARSCPCTSGWSLSRPQAAQGGRRSGRRSSGRAGGAGTVRHQGRPSAAGAVGAAGGRGAGVGRGGGRGEAAGADGDGDIAARRAAAAEKRGQAGGRGSGGVSHRRRRWRR